jgi:trk system potassium uptake protein TrkA
LGQVNRIKGKKHIVVIGLGELGRELAQQLAKECEILALDREEALVATLDKVQRALIVDVRDFHSLSSVVTSEFDEAIVSMGKSLESSILATLYLKKIGVKRIWAKATTEDHTAILKSVGASEIIFPERETARRLAAQLINPTLLDFVPLDEDYRVMDVAPPDSFYGHTLIDLDLRRRFGVFVLAIKELVPTRFVFMPLPDFVIKPSDIMVMIGKEQNLVRLREKGD